MCSRGTYLVIYMCSRGTYFASFYDFSIGLLNCSDCVILCFYFMLFVSANIPWYILHFYIVFLVTLYTETQWFLLNITRTLLFQEQQYQGMKQIFSKTLWLMKLLARENKEVQEKLFHHLDTLLSVQIVPSDLALSLKEVRLRFFFFF